MGGFKITEQSSTDKWFEAEETLWLNAGRDKLVADGDPAAAFLFTTPGKRISVEDAEKYGLVKAKARAEDKQAAPAANKARKPSGKKG